MERKPDSNVGSAPARPSTPSACPASEAPDSSNLAAGEFEYYLIRPGTKNLLPELVLSAPLSSDTSVLRESVLRNCTIPGCGPCASLRDQRNDEEVARRLAENAKMIERNAAYLKSLDDLFPVLDSSVHDNEGVALTEDMLLRAIDSVKFAKKKPFIIAESTGRADAGFFYEAAMKEKARQQAKPAISIGTGQVLGLPSLKKRDGSPVTMTVREAPPPSEGEVEYFVMKKRTLGDGQYVVRSQPIGVIDGVNDEFELPTPKEFMKQAFEAHDAQKRKYQNLLAKSAPTPNCTLCQYLVPRDAEGLHRLSYNGSIANAKCAHWLKKPEPAVLKEPRSEAEKAKDIAAAEAATRAVKEAFSSGCCYCDYGEPIIGNRMHAIRYNGAKIGENACTRAVPQENPIITPAQVRAAKKLMTQQFPATLDECFQSAGTFKKPAAEWQRQKRLERMSRPSGFGIVLDLPGEEELWQANFERANRRVDERLVALDKAEIEECPRLAMTNGDWRYGQQPDTTPLDVRIKTVQFGLEVAKSMGHRYGRSKVTVGAQESTVQCYRKVRRK